jgi:hypothetical protein
MSENAQRVMSSDTASASPPDKCPFCRSDLDPAGESCSSCGAALVARSPDKPRPADPLDGDREGRRRLAVTRRAYDEQPIVVWQTGPGIAQPVLSETSTKAADEPVITLDPIKIGPDTCSGCDDKAIFVDGGQASVYLLEGCDDDWCYYENPQGIA